MSLMGKPTSSPLRPKKEMPVHGRHSGTLSHRDAPTRPHVAPTPAVIHPPRGLMDVSRPIKKVGRPSAKRRPRQEQTAVLFLWVDQTAWVRESHTTVAINARAPLPEAAHLE